MKRLFVSIYKYFAVRRVALGIMLALLTGLMVYGATKVRIDENISSFFPSEGEETDFVMKNMNAMEKIVVILRGDSTATDEDVYDAAEMYADTLGKCIGKEADIEMYYDEESEEQLLSYVWGHLPLLLDDKDYERLDSITEESAIREKMAMNREMMLSPMSAGLGKLLPYDPLGMAWTAIKRLETIRPESTIEMRDGYMVSGDDVVLTINLHQNFSETGDNASVVKAIRETAKDIERQRPVSIYAYGAPIVAVSNSERVKADETVTVSIALAITALVIFLTFKRKRAVVLILLPVVYGALFAFAIVGYCGIEMSLISIGTGAMVLGLAMSYSIHTLTHSLHSTSTEQLIEEMAYPMTVGSITTIGAFVGLTFTDSKILQDLGIFASLALVGTLIFCLIVLPHFISTDGGKEKSRMMRIIERVAGYDYASNKYVVGALCILTAVGLMYFGDVHFNADMNGLNYQGDKWINKSKEIVETALTPNDTAHHSTLVVTGKNYDELARHAERLIAKVEKMESVKSCTTLAPWFLQSIETQNKKIARWESYWTEERRERVKRTIEKTAVENGFEADAFASFIDIIDKKYESSDQIDMGISAFGNYISQKDETMMLYVNMTMDNATKDATMEQIGEGEGVVVTDMGYFVRKATNGIVDNFNYILLVSSLLVGLVLLISYGRFELFVMTFLPMCISWVMILGMMVICGVEFNVVNIILSTFIFGVGDDFSIFIMDGLQSRYRGDKDMLTSHKTAIALSGIAVIVGLGVQIFAQHPACKSIGYLSIFGLVAVILTSYVVQPILFRTFITNPAKKGEPYTIKNLVRSAIYYLTFLIGCLIAYIMLGLMTIVPLRTRVKKRIAHCTLWGFMKAFYWMIGLSFPIKKIGHVDISRPSIIIANHQSFIDIINVLSISPKIVCVTKSWVVNSPLFGPLTKFCDFYNADEGSSEMAEKMRQCTDEGYSIVIFPEGTRSDDGEIHRFHKGAFLLAEQLELDITPMVIYGNGMVASKSQPLNLKDGWIVNKILPRIAVSDSQYGTSYSERSKAICALMRKEYDNVRMEYDTDENPHFREAIHHKYVYKEIYSEYELWFKLRDKEFIHREREKL